MKRQDTYSVRVSVDGRDLGIWDKSGGGDVDSEETTYRPGGLADQVALGGSRSTENVTVSRLYDEDAHAVYFWLVTRAGRGSMIVTRQPLDADGNAFGRPVVWSGRVKRVTAPEVDSESSDAALIEVEMTVNGLPS